MHRHALIQASCGPSRTTSSVQLIILQHHQMYRCSVLLAVSLMAFWAAEVDSARILGLFNYQAKSHFAVYEALLKGLAARGHNVTVLSHFPQKHKLPNYTDLSIKGSAPDMVNNFTVESVRDFGYLGIIEFVLSHGTSMCENSMNLPTVQNLLKTDDKFDLIITEIFGSDCCYGFVHKFNVPVIAFVSSVALPWANARVGNPDNPSYIPSYFLPLSSQMKFKERLINTVFYGISLMGEYFYSRQPTDKILRQHFGEDMPPLSELINKRTSLMFVNSHFSLNQPRPAVPSFVEIGGVHIPPLQTLPQDLEKFLNESTEGVVYFSFGTIVKANSLPRDKLLAFAETFRKIPQRVLWKIEGEVVNELPPNIKAAIWLPQLEILSHPNVRAFISHGGLLGTQEAVYTGVPVLGIPLFADQRQNIESLALTGMAVKLDYDEITEETFSRALNAVLEDKSYRETAKHLSTLFRDRPQSALETGIYWTEYVIRHRGAPHLRSAAVDMPLYQYLLLDVIAVLFIVILGLVATTWFVLKTLLSFILSGKDRQSNKLKVS